MSLSTIACRVSTLAAVLAVGVASPVHAQSHPWTTVGSTGTVDEADTRLVEFVLGEARMRATAAAGSELNLRYNVVSLPGFAGPGQYVLRVRFRDNGAAARVRLNLRRYNTNGLTSQLASFDSNAYRPQVGYQTRQRCIAVNWNFSAGPHYIDAALTKSGEAGRPALGIVQLIPANCTP